MAHLYKQYMRLVAQWPKDPTKGPARNLGAFMEQEIERVFRKEPSALPREAAICERRLRSLEHIFDNQHMKAYPHNYKSGVFGLTLEHLEEATSDKFRKQMGLGSKKPGFFKRLFGKSQ
uniref:Mitochondrial nucleoid factor 1 n=1 Tax=Steinernema glaseri TaxID=37863 RepID=A0A1I7YX41_9BILA